MIGVCVSNQKPILDGIYKFLFQKLINKSSNDWSEEFMKILDSQKINYKVVYIDHSDWIEQIKECEILIWKPKYMGLISSTLFKDKIYFIEHILGKRIFPNYSTVWHFDNKAAQSYLLNYREINTPKTFFSMDYNQTYQSASKLNYPIVMKKINGAGASNTFLVKNRNQFINIIKKEFILRIFLSKLIKNYERFGYVYFQEFLENNPGDLRITVIGDRYAVGFWRKNRKNDFRASGSGIIDYTTNIPIEIIEYCVSISKHHNFDSIAYDILFDKSNYRIIEFSYGFVDKAVYNAKGYFELDNNGRVKKFVKGNYSPQYLWLKWALNITG